MSQRRHNTAVRPSPQPPPVFLLWVLLFAVVCFVATGKSFLSLRDVVSCGKSTPRRTTTWRENSEYVFTVSSSHYSVNQIFLTRTLSSLVFRVVLLQGKGFHYRLNISPMCGILYVLWHKHQIEWNPAFSVSYEIYRLCEVTEISKMSKWPQLELN